MTKGKEFKTMDGNTAAAYVAYAFTEIASVFPITPSSPMAEHIDEWAAEGRKNLFGHTVRVQEMQSEGGAVATMHGALQCGSLANTFTSSQGLMLMIPSMFKIAGELLPGVFHVASRTVASHALTIFAEHNDVMTTRSTGIAMLAESSVQEVMDLSAVAHATAISSRIPFMNFFDGFRTSHEIQKIEVLDYKELKEFLDEKSLLEFRQRALNPDNPVWRGACETGDIYMQHLESRNKFYDAIPDMVENYMKKVKEITGREYHLFNYTGVADAESVIVIMGSGAEVTEETVRYLNKQGRKVGCLNIHLFRPWSEKHFIDAIPKTVKKIVVLDRSKEAGANGDPVYQSVASTFATVDSAPKVYAGRFGLGGKEYLPADVVACFDNLEKEIPKNHFVVGIVDDVTNLSLDRTEALDLGQIGLHACKFWGFGSDGTVGANKTAIKIIGDNTDLYAQGYFAYDSKKSGGVTVSHLRFGKETIKMPYLIHTADFIACHRQSYVKNFDLLQGVKKGGTFLLNCTWTIEELDEKLPASLKRSIARSNVKFYIVDAVGIAKKIGLGGRINMVMQSAFFKLANVIPLDLAISKLKESVVTSYGNKGQHVVDMNWEAIDAGVNAIVPVEYPASWEQCTDDLVDEMNHSEFFKKFAAPMEALQGDSFPVSIYDGWEDGTYPLDTAKEEKRGASVSVPKWDVSKCVQCNKCSFVCPHAAIRPFLTTDSEVKEAPAGLETKKAVGKEAYNFSIAVSVKDCLGCTSCTKVCPAGALEMADYDQEEYKSDLWNYLVKLPQKENFMNKNTVKGSQFEMPYLEFTGACAGCAETPYAKVITQLFGDRMIIANAHGCSNVWGGSAPTNGYKKNQQGHGPAWGNSLFEDNAEYGYGYFLGDRNNRQLLKGYVDEAMSVASSELASVLKNWADKMEESEGTRERADAVVAALEKEKEGKFELERIYDLKQNLIKRSTWIFGGDGWAYDIGFGGLDHVLALDENVNVFVFDTEVYSNTGGQPSKATPTAAVGKFATMGKRTKKKDLGMMCMSYGYIYVAQVAMGADPNQFMKAIAEAEAYNGPSIVIGYAPCINHGLKSGQGNSQLEQKRAVDSGYWHLYRYNPDLKDQGKNPFSLDSQVPQGNFRDFLLGEVRFASLQKVDAASAEALYAKTEKDAKDRYENYVHMQEIMKPRK